MDSTPLFEAILEGMFGEGKHKNQGDPSLSHGEFRPEAALASLITASRKKGKPPQLGRLKSSPLDNGLPGPHTMLMYK